MISRNLRYKPQGQVSLRAGNLNSNRTTSTAVLRARNGIMRYVAAVLAAIVIAGAYAPSAVAETRTLKLYYLHTKERAEITYKKNGRYLPDGLRKLNRFLRDWRRNEPTKMDPQLFDLVWEAYQKSGSRDYIHVISGYRSPATNSMLRKRGRGVAKKSQHMLGKAMDFYLPDVSLSKLRAIGLKIQGGGVGYYPRSGSPFVHLDVGSVRHWPRMNRQQLMAMFPDGKTLHMPSDGKPLPGYNTALANYKKRKSGSSTVSVASASSALSGGRDDDRGFLATLFGGGRDEEEENASDFQTASKGNDEVIKPAKSVPEPRKSEPPPVETLIASLPTGKIPLPAAAPRPQRDVGPAADQAAPADQGTIVVADIPVPSRRPAYTAVPSAAENKTEDMIAALVRDAESRKNEEAVYVTALAQELSKTEALAGRVLASTESASSARNALRGTQAPDPGEDGGPAVKSGRVTHRNLALPEMVPAPEERGATAKKSGRLKPAIVMASANTGQQASKIRLQQSAFVDSGVRVAPKMAKPESADVMPETGPVVVPVSKDKAIWAFRASHVPDIKSTSTLAQSAIRAQPTTVYKLGFGDVPNESDAHRFTGKAVTFLSIAKFTATN